MALHMAATMAFFAGAAQQGQVVVQCAPPAPELWLKWLLPTIVQTLVSLASIAAGLSIAVWSFKKNQRSEHEQWIRDQKKAEWRVLLDAVSKSQFHLQVFATPTDELPTGTRTPLLEGAQSNQLEIYRLLEDSLFIDQSILDQIRSEWHKAIQESKSQTPTDNRTAVSYLAWHSLTKKVRDGARKDLKIVGETKT